MNFYFNELAKADFFFSTKDPISVINLSLTLDNGTTNEGTLNTIKGRVDAVQYTKGHLTIGTTNG